MRIVAAMLFGFHVAIAGSVACADEEPVDKLLERARQQSTEGKLSEAITTARTAIEAAPDDPRGYLLRAQALSRSGKHTESLADYDRALKLQPDSVNNLNLRGAERFRALDFTGAIEDFDRAIELAPKIEAEHWQRGIAYYYAGRFQDGEKQFAAYQTFYDNDVENVVWRFLCMARDKGFDQARADLLKVRDDRRVPMMQVYALFAGKAEPDDVLSAVKAGDPPADELRLRQFYADLYLGLYYEAGGDADLARKHINAAADAKLTDHYMWDVARVHADVLKKMN